MQTLRHDNSFYLPPYDNKVNCAILLFRSKQIGKESLHYLAFGPQFRYCPPHGLTVQWCQVQKCRPWVTVHSSLGTSVLRNRINLDISIHTSRTHSRLLYFKHKQLNDQSNMELQRINVFHVQMQF